MKTSSFLCAALTIAALNFSLPCGQAAPVSKTAASTNDVSKSTFTIPQSNKDGCDPFFPTSTRVWGVTVSASDSAPKQSKPTGIDCLILKGLSGAPANPLAMINGRTMAPGEDAEISTDCGRLLVHCVEITTNAAIIEVSGERRELHLRSDF